MAAKKKTAGKKKAAAKKKEVKPSTRKKLAKASKGNKNGVKNKARGEADTNLHVRAFATDKKRWQKKAKACKHTDGTLTDWVSAVLNGKVNPLTNEATK